MTTIVFGVEDKPYSFRANVKSKRGRVSSATTGDVAEILEDHYQIYQQFFDQKSDMISVLLQTAISDSFEAMMKDLPTPRNPLAGAESEIETMFMAWLSAGTNVHSINPKYPVPTAASQAGVSLRFKKKQKKGRVRVSFYDTGLYMNAFRVWVE